MTPTASLQVVEPQTDAAIELLADWTPESLKLAIQREKQLRNLIVEYCKSAMNEGHHYYNLGGQAKKPALSKEGALNLCSLFKVTPSPDAVHETFHDDGHYTVRARTHVIGRNGQILATGDGLCTSRESKYAHRWMWASEVPADVNKEDLKKKEWNKNGKNYVQYQVPNQDLPDIFNTTLKMAAKRALVDAVLKLPLVSELFTQDLDEQIAENTQKKQTETQTRSAQVKDEGHRDVPAAPNGKDDMRQRVVNLLEKLQERDFSEAELLGNLGYASVEQIPEEELGEAVKDLSKTLNAALNNK